MKNNGIGVVRCSHDADTQIVKAAVEYAHECPVEVKAEDTDISVMLVHHGANTKNANFLTNSKGVSYNLKQIHAKKHSEHLIFLHSFTGCDTVSTISSFGKVTALSKLCNSEKAEV